MNRNSLQPDHLPMEMLSYSADATGIDTLNSKDYVDPRELCNSLYAPTAHEDGSWPFPNGGALDDVPTQPNVLELDSHIDFNSESLYNDLNIPSTMQLASNALTAPRFEEYPSFGPSPIQSLEIKVKKGDNKCPQCSRLFTGGAAAVRKHINQVHIKRGQIEGDVVRSTPGRAKTEIIPENKMLSTTRRKKADREDAQAYLPPATHNQSKESTQVTIQELRNTQKELATLRQHFADLQVFAMRLQAGMNNQSHDILTRFDKPFERHLFESLENLRTTSPLLTDVVPLKALGRRWLFQMCSLIDTIQTRYPKEIGRRRLVYVNGALQWSTHYRNRTFKYKVKHENEKTLRGEAPFQISIDIKSDSLCWVVKRNMNSEDSESHEICFKGTQESSHKEV